MTINNKLLSFLEKQLGPSKRYSGEEFYFRCPLCQRADNAKKLAIKLDPNAKDKDGNNLFGHWHCWRDTQHKGTNLFQLLKRIKSSQETYNELKNVLGKGTALQNFDSKMESFQNYGKKAYVKVKGLPTEFLSLLEERNNPHYKNAYRYVTKDRGLSREDIFKYNIGYCETGKYAGYIIIPSYDEDMNVNYFVSRSYYNSTMKHKNPPFKKDMVFNEIFINWKERITLVEGVFDMMSVKRNCIPLLGKNINNNIKLKILKNRVKEICIALDSDAIKQSVSYIEEFMRNDINVYYVKLPKKDPNEIGFNKMTLLLKTATLLLYKDLIKMKINL